MIAPARTAAYDILSAVSAGTTDLGSALASSRADLKDDRDRALAAEIATGVLRRRALLDHLIERGANRPLHRLDPEVLEILRLSLYQLLYLTRVPASAVVDDAVNMTKKLGKKSASGLVNAVLRGLSRNRKALPLPPRPVEPAATANLRRPADRARRAAGAGGRSANAHDRRRLGRRRFSDRRGVRDPGRGAAALGKEHWLEEYRPGFVSNRPSNLRRKAAVARDVELDLLTDLQ